MAKILLGFVGLVFCMLVTSAGGGIVALAVAGVPMPNCGWVCSYLQTWLGTGPLRRGPAVLAGNCLDPQGLAKLAQFTEILAYPEPTSEAVSWPRLHSGNGQYCLSVDKVATALCRDVGGGSASREDCDRLLPRRSMPDGK